MARPIRVSLNSLYIEPISACNLRCRCCYSNVVNGPDRRVIPAGVILDFAQRFLAVSSPPPAVICWCGTGEVLLHPDFPQITNRLLATYGEDALTMQIQTNGTLGRLREFDSLERIDFRVSIDGPRRFHEWNRGADTYDRTLAFCREAVELGCRSLVVRMLATAANIVCLDEFQEELRERVGPGVEVWLNTQYTNRDLARLRPLTSWVAPGPIEDATALARPEVLRILHERYQDRYALDEDPLGVTNYVSLTTQGVYNCCHRISRLGDADTDMALILARLAAAAPACRACPLFPC